MSHVRAPGRSFGVLWFGQFASVAGLTVVVPLLPFYLATLGLPPSAVAWWTGAALAAPAVTQLIAAPLWGMVGDRFGHKTMVVRAHAGLALAVGLMALADTPVEFLASRLVQGAFGGVASATAAYASSLAPPQRQGRVLGGLFGATGAGALLGPLVGSVLASRFGFGTLFLYASALLLLSAALAMTLLPRHVPFSGATPHEDSRPALRDVLGMLRHDQLSRTLLIAGLLGQASIYALVVVFAPQVERITGAVSTATVWVGVLQASTWAASLLGGPWWGWRNDRRAAQTGFAIAAAGCAVAVALQALPTTPEMLLPLRILQGFFFAALTQSVLHVICHQVGEQARGAALGAAYGLLDLGQVFGPFAGALAASILPVEGAFLAIGGMLAVAGILATLTRRLPRDVGPVPAPPAPALIEVKS